MTNTYNVGGNATFEYHVVNPKGVEIGIAGPNGWKGRHGFAAVAPAEIPRDVINKLNGVIVNDMRRLGLVLPKGTQNIKDFIRRFLRPDKANVMSALVCQVNPAACEGFQEALECTLNRRKAKCQDTQI